MGYEPFLKSDPKQTRSKTMKTTKEQAPFERMAEMFWRGQVQACTTPEQALKILQDDAGLDGGRAIFKLREYSPTLYVAHTKARREFQPTRNARMSHFNFRNVNA
jgi:hypothetical protein